MRRTQGRSYVLFTRCPKFIKILNICNLCIIRHLFQADDIYSSYPNLKGHWAFDVLLFYCLQIRETILPTSNLGFLLFGHLYCDSFFSLHVMQCWHLKTFQKIKYYIIFKSVVMSAFLPEIKKGLMLPTIAFNWYHSHENIWHHCREIFFLLWTVISWIRYRQQPQNWCLCFLKSSLFSILS